MALYHVEKGIPASVINRLPKVITGLKFTEHAKAARHDAKYGELPEVNFIQYDARVIEVETVGEQPVKVLYRQSFTDSIDLCVAVYLPTRSVKTVWANRVDDIHSSINLSKYD